MKEITGEAVARLAEETLEEWLPGYTEYDGENDSQWRIVFLGNGRFRVSERDQPDQTFRVSVQVVAEK